jgi:hypothetical protein
MTATLTTTTRTLHLVDLENLVGDPMADGAAALDALDRYLTTAGHQNGDHVVLSANPGLVRTVMFDLPVPCNVHAVTGTDGADLMLLDQAEPAFVAARFGRLVVGSGDHEFLTTALAVRDLGVPVVVVARRCSLARVYTGQGLGVRILPEPVPAVALAV